MSRPTGPLADHLSAQALLEDRDNGSEYSDDTETHCSAWEQCLKWCRQELPQHGSFLHWFESLHPTKMFTRFLVSCMPYIIRISPSAVRQTAYRASCQGVLRSIDRLDAKLPGGSRGWSRRWLSRPRKGVMPKGWGCKFLGPEDTITATAAVAAAAGMAMLKCSTLFGMPFIYFVFFVASIFCLWDLRYVIVRPNSCHLLPHIDMMSPALWCGWRRLPPVWGILTVEIVCGSVFIAQRLARDAGHRDARMMEARVECLEHSLEPLFRNISSCMRMVRCAQALSFGLRLSIPMPPISRMEARFEGAGDLGSSTGPAVRELRTSLADVLQGAIEQTTYAIYVAAACRWPYGNQYTDVWDAGDTERKCYTEPQMLAQLSKLEIQLPKILRDYVFMVAVSLDRAPTCWEMGVRFESERDSILESLEHLGQLFRAAAERLVVVMGADYCGFPIRDITSPSNNVTAVGSTLYGLRLGIEEVLVRLFLCQSKLHMAMNISSGNAGYDWQPLLQEFTLAQSALTDARLDAMWTNMQRTIEILAQANTDGLGPTGVQSSDMETPPVSGPGEHVDAGVMQTASVGPRTCGPDIYEGGKADDNLEGRINPAVDRNITDILVAVAAPDRAEQMVHESTCSTPTLNPSDDSCAQLMGELSWVLQARPQPETCVKTLPDSVEVDPVMIEHDAMMVEHQDVIEDGLASCPSPKVSLGNQGKNLLVSALREQLSVAANEEIFTFGADEFDGSDLHQSEDGSGGAKLPSSP
ncbi:unnamed protein product [Choristocarpus tenellus]